MAAILSRPQCVDLCSTVVTALLSLLSCYVGPRCNGTLTAYGHTQDILINHKVVCEDYITITS